MSRSRRRSRQSIPKAWHSDQGKVPSPINGMNRARATFQNGLWTNSFNHHVRQRSRVRRSMPRLSRKARTRSALSPCRMAETNTTTTPSRPYVPENAPTEAYAACGIPPGHSKNYRGRSAWDPPRCPPVRLGVCARNQPDAVCPYNASNRLGDKVPPNRYRIAQETQIGFCPPGNSGPSSLRFCCSHSEMGRMTPVKQAFTGVPFLRHFEGHLRLSITHRASNRRFYPRFARRCS